MIDKNKFVVGARVHEFGYRSYTGTVASINLLDDSKPYIQWDGMAGSKPLPCSIDHIRLIDEEADKALAAKAQVKIDEAALSLEAAFKAWREAIGMYEGVNDMVNAPLIDVSRFANAVEASSGWSMSSLYC